MLLFHLHHNYCGEDREQSKARDMRPRITSQAHMRGPRTHLHKYAITVTRFHPDSIPINICSPNLSVYFQPHPSPIPPFPHHPSLPMCQLFFWIGFIYLMMAVLMTLRTRLMVKQAPQHLTNEDCVGTGERGGCEWKGRNEIGGAQQKEWVEPVTPCTQAVFVFLKQTRTPNAEKKLITTPWTDFNTVAQMRGTYPPLIRDRLLLAWL